MKLLMHICCAPCSLYPLTVVRDRGIEVSGLWFNPNIHPFIEYKNRFDSVKKLKLLWGLNIEYKDEYGLKEFLRNIVGREDNRCEYCYSVRLEETAKKAKEINADAFTTSLLVSPYQKFDAIISIGRLIQDRYGVEFYAEDFKSGFNEGRRLSRELKLYRQKYCGCIYSEIERYIKTGSRN